MSAILSSVVSGKTRFHAEELSRLKGRLQPKLAALHCGGESLAEFFAVITTSLGDFGLEQTAMAAGLGVDFVGLENEPGGCHGRSWLGWQAQHFVEVMQGDGRVEFGLASGYAFGFHFVKGFLGGGQDAVEALLVHGEIDEGLGVLEKDGGGGHGGVDL